MRTIKYINQVSLVFPSRSANEGFARSAAASFAAQLDPTLDELGDVKTAVSEAVTNAIVHAYPDALGKVELKLRLYPENEFEVVVRDWGVGIENIDQARTPLFTTGSEERAGMGFTIMESFMDTVKVRSRPGKGTTVTMLRAAQAGDQAACGQLVEENQGLIWSIVRRYARGHLELDDLYQLGCLGFLKAVQGFNLAFGTQFSTYAVPKIAGEIRRFLRDDSMVKIGRGRKERGYLIQKARASLSAELGREPVLSELSQATGLTPEEIAEVDLATAPVASLQAEMGEDGLSFEGVLGSDSPEESIVEKLALRTAIDALPERERQLILLRYFKGLTQDKTAKVLGISQVQVSRLEKKILLRLRGELSGG